MSTITHSVGQHIYTTTEKLSYFCLRGSWEDSSVVEMTAEAWGLIRMTVVYNTQLIIPALEGRGRGSPEQTRHTGELWDGLCDSASMNKEEE